ncbi:hypothetical protein, partial [Escherichia coli]|uniref:hypothetical protein n=1 Tax=Escherichia coli TaxID=562 RepID=UPI003CE5858E
PNMLIVKRIAKELFLLQERYFPANSMGLANVTDSISFKTVLELGDHDLVNNDNSLILLPKTKFGVVQTINGSNAINEIDRKKA